MPFWNLRPIAVGDYDFWTLGAGASKVAAVDPGDPVTHDNDTSYITIGASPGVNAQQSFKLGARPLMASLITVRWISCSRHLTIGPGVESIEIFSRMNGVNGAQTPTTPGTGYAIESGVLARPGGGTWSIADIENPDLQIAVGVPSDNADAARNTTTWVELEYVPADPGRGREIATSFLRVVRRRIEYVKLNVGPSILDAQLMDDISLSHFSHPLTQFLGVEGPDGLKRPGTEGWRRILMQLRAVSINLNTFECAITLRRRRSTGELLTYYDSGQSRRSSSGIQDGLARRGTGGKMTFTRSTKKWLPDPASGLVVLYEVNQLPLSLNGLEFDGFSANYVTRSSFISDLTGWSVTGTVTSATRNNVFDPTVATKSMRIQGASNGQHTLATPGANPNRFSVDYEIDALAGGSSLIWSLQRPSDSFWFRDSDQTWQVTEINNVIDTVITTSPKRFKSKLISNLGTTSAPILKIKTLTSGDDAYISHVQLEPGQRVTSRIVTNGGAIPREADIYKVTHSASKPAINLASGTFIVEWIPNFNYNEHTEFLMFWNAREDANNTWGLGWDGTNQRFDFFANAGGVPKEALKSEIFSDGNVVIVACRWCSSVGELGLLPYTMSVFSGVGSGLLTKGSDIVRASSVPVITSLSIGDATAGANEGSKIGTLRRILFTQEVLSDGEIQARKFQ